MVKFYSQNNTYDYPFATVTLAYFLRYPNPYSRHVISTDVLDRQFDPSTGQLSTTRLHLKKSRLPSAILKLLPRSLLGTSATGESQSYILERSIIDIRTGWMRTESRNLNLRTVLDVIERQTYIRSSPEAALEPPTPSILDSLGSHTQPQYQHAIAPEQTDVRTIVTLHSRLGQRLRQQLPSNNPEPAPRTGNFLYNWSQERLQRSIEAIGLSRAHKSQPNAMEGMKVVLERLRDGGLVGVLEGMRRDREAGSGLLSGGGSQRS